jgi:hypothetical protein
MLVTEFSTVHFSNRVFGGVDDDADERAKKRLNRFRQELADEGISLVENDTVDAPWNEGKGLPLLSRYDASRIENALVEELLYARATPVHENRRSSYGSILLENYEPDRFEDDFSNWHITWIRQDPDIEDCRELCNGLTTFLIRYTNVVVGIAVIPSASEHALSQFASQTRSYVVQRHPNGSVRLYGWNRSLAFENDKWVAKRYPQHWARQLLHLAPPNHPHREIAEALMEFCLLTLSPRHIGATLVWLLDGNASELAWSLSRPSRGVAAALNVRSAGDREVIATLLSSLDGACLIEANGDIAGVEAVLQFSSVATQYVGSAGGTRHASAAKYSFDHPEVLVIVVSSDGPVTVFSDGAAVLYWGQLYSYAADDWAIGNSPDLRDSLRLEKLQCSNCQRKLLLEYQPASKPDSLLRIVCPVCRQPTIQHESEVYLIARTLKPWEDGSSGVLYRE